jgi:protoporphyrin/coproporphyrin ferrochelatase
MTPCPLGLGGQCYCANHVSSFLSDCSAGTLPTVARAPRPRPSDAQSKSAVLLLAHGSPENPAQVPEFLKSITGNRPLPPQVVAEVQHRYSLIGFSPLACWTLQQAHQLSSVLQMPVFVGMRNWRPRISDAVNAIAAQGFERVIAICMAPQNSRTSVGLYRRAATGETKLPFDLDFVEEWHDHPLLAKAFAEKLCSGWEKACAENEAKLPVIFTAHSVPQRTITEGDPYEAQSKETAALVAKEAGLSAEEWVFAFQSQGMSGGTWIGPPVEATIQSLKADGHRGVFLQPIGFLCDHVEVLYDIDIAFKQFAEREGMRLWRAESLNGSPTLTAALAEVVRARLAS